MIVRDLRLGLGVIESAKFSCSCLFFGFQIMYLNLEGLVFHVGSEVVD
jgi:hypothetical protein